MEFIVMSFQIMFTTEFYFTYLANEHLDLFNSLPDYCLLDFRLDNLLVFLRVAFIGRKIVFSFREQGLLIVSSHRYLTGLGDPHWLGRWVGRSLTNLHGNPHRRTMVRTCIISLNMALHMLTQLFRIVESCSTN